MEILTLELAVEIFEACCVEEEEEEEWMIELLTVRMEGMEEDLFVDVRTGRSSSTSCGVRETAEEVETSPRISERT